MLDGTVRCWGYNGYGQLGDQTQVEKSHPVHVLGISSSVVALAAANDSNCALLGDGTVECWGADYDGQLGDGEETSKNYPIAVKDLSQVSTLVGGYSSYCSVLSTTGLSCWGGGATVWDQTPFNAGVVSAALGMAHACVMLAAGPVQCTGNTGSGQVGNGSFEGNSPSGRYTRYDYVDVIGLASTVAAIAAGDDHTCALLSTGEVKCWGSNSKGQLGNGTGASKSSTPVKVPAISAAVAIAARGKHTCVIVSPGQVKCWGANAEGQLGDGSAKDSQPEPVDVKGLTQAVAISVGGSHTCALLSGGTAKCWGANTIGQLGNGTKNNQPIPVDVLD